jgi:phage/plasmid primase-like uncharacterized protein
VAERLWEVARELARRRVDLLRQQAEWTCPGAERGVEVLRFVEAPLTDQIVYEPEAAQQKGALVTRYAVGRVVVPVAVEETAARAQAISDRPSRVLKTSLSKKQEEELRAALQARGAVAA